MAARVHRLGTIYSRVDGLIRKGHMKPKDRPIWFDVYKAFPPTYEPTFKRRAPEEKVKEIFYKEDALRARIQKEYREQLGLYHLEQEKEPLSEQLLKTCQQYILDGLSEEEAIKKLDLHFKELKESKSNEGETNKANLKNLLDVIL